MQKNDDDFFERLSNRDTVTKPDLDNVYILGYTPEGFIIIWKNGVISSIKDKDLSAARWLLLTGANYSKEEFPTVKMKILSIAYSHGVLYANNSIGNGIYYENDRFYLLNGDEIISYSPFAKTKFFVQTLPLLSSKIVNLHGKKWIQCDQLSQINDLSDAKIDLHKAFEDTYALVSKWNFSVPEMGKYLTAFMMLAPFSTVMKWRPVVYIIGRRGVGKTTFLDVFENLWENLAVRLDKATAYSIAQTVGNTAKIPILDEFENDRHITDMLNLLKNTTGEAGGTILRGTNGATAQKYHIKQMFWLASIYLPPSLDAAISSRMAFFQMTKSRNPFVFPNIDDLKKLRHLIISSIVPLWEEIEKRATDYRNNKNHYKVQDGRLIDNYSYAAALIDVAGFEGGIPEFLNGITFGEDEESIIDAILDSKIKYLDFEGSIAEALTKDNDLQTFGIRKTTHQGKEYLALKPDVIVRLLLKDTKYKDMDISAPLERIEGSLKQQVVRMNGRNVRTILIPYEKLNFE